MPSSSAARYSSWSAMWACTRSTSSPASTASSTSRRTSAGGGVGESGPGRQQVGALQEQPLAVDRADPVVPRHLAQPGAAGPAVAHLAVDERRRRRSRSAAGRRAPAATTAGAGRRRATTRSRCCRRPAGARSRRPPRRRPTSARRTVRATSLSRRACRRRWARVSSASRHSTRSRSSLTGPGVVHEHGAPDAARVPVPGDGLGVLEQAGDVAPAGRARSGLHVTSTASTWSSPSRDRAVTSKLCGKK